MQELCLTALQWVVILALFGIAMTILVLHHRRSFDEGYEKGEAADPEKVRRENPPSIHAR
jgi:hypothetical protein